MDLETAKRALERVAGIEMVSLDKIRGEIELLIAREQKNPDPKVQEFWASVPRQGDKITAEELIMYIADIICEDQIYCLIDKNPEKS